MIAGILVVAMLILYPAAMVTPDYVKGFKGYIPMMLEIAGIVGLICLI